MQIERCLRITKELHTKVWVNGILTGYKPSVFEGVRKALDSVLGLEPCHGVTDHGLQDLASWVGSDHYREIRYKGEGESFSMVRSRKCLGIGNVCKMCRLVSYKLKRKKCRRLVKRNVQLHRKTPLVSVCKGKVSKALRDQRKRSQQLERQVRRMRSKISKESVEVTDEVHSSLVKVMEREDLASPLVRLFWKEQKKNFGRSASGHRWHPMIIRLAILLHSQSSQAYRSLKETGVLQLPCEATLRDYTNAINPMQGFNPEVCELESLINKSFSLIGKACWVLMLTAYCCL